MDFAHLSSSESLIFYALFEFRCLTRLFIQLVLDVCKLVSRNMAGTPNSYRCFSPRDTQSTNY